MSQASSFACPSCGKEYRWKPEMAGRRAKCKCGGVVEVPVTDPALAAAPEPEPEPAFDDVFAAADAEHAPAEVPRQAATSPAPSLPREAPLVTASGVPIPRRAKIDNTPSTHERWHNIWSGIGGTFVGLLLCGYAYFEFYTLGRLEAEGGSHRMRIWVRVIYEIGGKWGVLIVLGAFGLLVVFGGVMTIMGKVDPDTGE